MSSFRMTGRLVAAARALAGVSKASFADAGGLSAATIGSLERGGSAWIVSPEHVEGVRGAMNHFGILLIDEADGLGAGVRLKFTRQDVRQVARLEGEGGIIGSDDAP